MNHLNFEELKEINELGEEYWWARDLYKILRFSAYKNFRDVLYKSIVDCEESGQCSSKHFFGFSQLMDLEDGSEQLIGNIQLSRYACYLIIQHIK